MNFLSSYKVIKRDEIYNLQLLANIPYFHEILPDSLAFFSASGICECVFRHPGHQSAKRFHCGQIGGNAHHHRWGLCDAGSGIHPKPRHGVRVYHRQPRSDCLSILQRILGLFRVVGVASRCCCLER